MKSKFYKLTFYNILANITVPLTGLVDTAILGNLDTHIFMAGAALAGILFDFIFWIFGFLRMGTTGLTAQASGEKNEKESLFILVRSIGLASFFGASILILSPWIKEFGFRLLEGESAVKAAGVSYFDARIPGSIAVLCNYVFTGWFLGREKSSYVLIATVIANMINITLDAYFILELGWEAYGAGLATTISQFGMLSFFLILLFREWRIDSKFELSWIREKALLSLSGFSSILRLNKDIFLRTLFLIITFSLFRNFSSEMGTEILAANSILHQMILVCAYLVDGAALSTESLAGNLYAEKKRKSLKILLVLALSVGFLFTTFFLIFLFSFPNITFGLITKSPGVLSILRQYQFWLVPVLEIGTVAFILDGFFIGLTQGRILRNSMLLSTTLFFLPIAYFGRITGNNHILWLSLAMLMLGRAWTLSAKAIQFFLAARETSLLKNSES